MNKIEALSLSVVAAILLPTMLTSCGKKTQGGKAKTAQKSENDFLDKDAKPDERKYLLAAKPFFIAIVNRKYADAYALLSSHARARMCRGWKLGNFHLISPRMTSIWELANPQLRDIAVYEPGKPIEETARELGIEPDAIIKLASNENPLGPSPKAIEAMRAALSNAHLYPDGSGFYLCKAVASKLGLAPDNVILGNGSNEVIEFLGHAFLNPGDDVIIFQYAFIIYKLLATSFAARTIELPTPKFQQDLDAMLEAITPKTRLIFIPNPNNPTGALVSHRAIDSFMSRVAENIVVVFDEAYFEFLDDPPDTLQYVREGRNVVVLRTFSKIHGLAGLRLGYGIATADLIKVLHKTRQPFNVNSIAQAGALAALEDDAHLRETKRVIGEGRAYLQGQFAEMQVPFVPAVANFVMVNVGDGCAVFEKLLRRQIIVRPLKGYGLPEWVRITVGTMEENKKLIAALSEVMLG